MHPNICTKDQKCLLCQNSNYELIVFLYFHRLTSSSSFHADVACVYVVNLQVYERVTFPSPYIMNLGQVQGA